MQQVCRSPRLLVRRTSFEVALLNPKIDFSSLPTGTAVKDFYDPGGIIVDLRAKISLCATKGNFKTLDRGPNRQTVLILWIHFLSFWSTT